MADRAESRGRVATAAGIALPPRIVEQEGSLAAFLWRFEPVPKQPPTPQSASTSPESMALSKELKRRG